MLKENGMQPGRPERSRDPDAPDTVEGDGSFPALCTEEWGAMNRRRSELIRKKNRQKMTAEERDEFDRLQHLCFAAIDERFPRLVVDEDGLKRLRESL